VGTGNSDGAATGSPAAGTAGCVVGAAESWVKPAVLVSGP
jgi:hypothetical protein